ncbi:MAG: acyl-CoA dehydrogenase family protein [Pseudomonadota bacterium]
MDFTLTLEQQMLKDSAARLLADAYDFEQRSAYMVADQGWSKAIWRQYAELGFLGIGIPEEFGGTGGGAFETMVVMEEMGRRLTLEPYACTAVICRDLLLSGGSPAHKQAYLPRIVSGDLVLALAALERQSRFDLHDVAATARRAGDGWVLDGRKTLVPHGDSADLLLVSARVAGGQRDSAGISLFIVDAATPGLSRSRVTQVDSHRAADVELRGVQVPASALLGEPGQALALLESAREAGVVALLAESTGCMEELLKMTVEYLKTRRQFGRTLASFQALQHRAVDMLMHLEQARSMTILATSLLVQPPSPERSRWIAGAKAFSCQAWRFVGEQGVQLHGGIGITMEHAVAHLFRRLVAMESALGDRDHHLERFSVLAEPAVAGA